MALVEVFKSEIVNVFFMTNVLDRRYRFTIDYVTVIEKVTIMKVFKIATENSQNQNC